MPSQASGWVTNARLEFIGTEANCQSGRQSLALISASAQCTPHSRGLPYQLPPSALLGVLYNRFLQQSEQTISYIS